ncbi:PBSX family phage terminase large subunit [Spirosoma sp. SC4-14]|uniref:PBSX family phage terminase large subunit n=1 Tax=Spirosoma sp. SC4-14 TaxID=3128900 RepID=UPI0030D585D0
MFACNPVFEPVFHASDAVRYIHLWGGRGRGGSFFATEYALSCLMDEVYFRGYLMRAVHKDIRESLWRDLMDRIDEKEEQGLLDRKDFKINTNDMSVVYLPTGNTIRSRGFKKSSKGQTAKMKSIAGATHVFVEEAEEIEEADFNQLDDSLRTVKGELRVFLIFNPPKKNHWILKRWYILEESRVPGYYIGRAKKQDNFLSIFSTYHNNRANLNQQTIDNFEAYKDRDEEHYYTVVRGLISEGAKGRIYKKWKAITNTDFNALPYTPYYVLDFGYGGDPLAFGMVKRHNKRRYAKQLIYGTEIGDDELVRRLRALKVGGRPIVADSAEPKSIAKLRQEGFNVIAARKTPDSVRTGIRTMQNLEWYYTDDSSDLIFEYQEYKWVLDENKNMTSEPEDKNNHMMDALRYGEITDPWGGGDIEHN